MMRVLQFVNLPSFYFTAVWLDSLVAVMNSASEISLVLTPTGFDKNFSNIEPLPQLACLSLQKPQN
jgi:hypothetical protein